MGSAATQTQTQDIELAPPQTYILCGLLEKMKGPILLIQSCRNSMAQGNNRIIGRNPREGPILMTSQKPGIAYQTSNHCNKHLRVKMCGPRGVAWDTL